MNFRIILFIIFAFLLSSCTDNEPVKPPVKPVVKAEEQQKKPHDDTAVTPKEGIVTKPTNPVFDLHAFDIETMDFVLGNRDAKVIFMEYSSPTCPHCSYFHKEVLPKLKEKYIDTGKIMYVLREFVANKQDLDAAIMGRCYQNEEDPLKLLNLLYIQQDSWAFSRNYREIITNMGGLAGVSRERFLQCLSNKEIIDFLLRQAKNITSYPGFIGTPAFLINGVMYKDTYSMDGISRTLDAKLKELEGSSANEQSK